MQADPVADDSALPRFAVPRAVRDWGRQHNITAPAPRRAAAMLAQTALWYAASVAFAELVGTWWAWVVAWISLVGCMIRIDTIHHESVHRSLFRRRAANDLVGCVAGALEGMHAPAYRCYHLAHHAYTRQDHEPHDPERLYDIDVTHPMRLGPITVPAPVVYAAGMLSGGVVLAAELLAGGLSTMLGRPRSYVRAAALERQVRRWGLLPIALWTTATVTAVATGHVEELLRWWLVPMALYLVGPYMFLTLSDHYGAPANGPMIYSTGTVESNALCRWILLEGNHHLAHHVFPNASWWWLKAATEVIEDDRSIRYSGYLSFHRQVWRDMAGRRTPPDRAAR